MHNFWWKKLHTTLGRQPEFCTNLDRQKLHTSKGVERYTQDNVVTRVLL